MNELVTAESAAAGVRPVGASAVAGIMIVDMLYLALMLRRVYADALWRALAKTLLVTLVTMGLGAAAALLALVPIAMVVLGLT
jgi:hypothetical protein